MLSSRDELAAESSWVAGMIRCWLDEEWPAAELVPVHADLGAAVGRACSRVRQREGVEEMGDLVLELASELLPYDFGPTFTDAFSCANKVAKCAAVCEMCAGSHAPPACCKDRDAAWLFAYALRSRACVLPDPPCWLRSLPSLSGC
jgi:hypothetical protein